jgi:hypothetical protein
LTKRKAGGAAWQQNITCGLYSGPPVRSWRARAAMPMLRHFAMTVNAPVKITAERRI